MKKNKILLTLLTSTCVGLVAGCGETKYNITTKVNDYEYGYVTGGGKYANGALVRLKVYPNEGCTATGMKFVRKGELDSTAATVENFANNEYQFQLNAGENGNVGTYIASFECTENSATDVGTSATKTHSVQYNIYDITYENNFRLITDFDSKAYKVNHNATLNKISYHDDYEGVITWYTDQSMVGTPYNFENKVTEDIILYGKVNNDAESIVETAIDNFKNSPNIRMDSGEYVNNEYVRGKYFAKVKDYNKNSEGKDAFYLYEYINGTDSSGHMAFMIEAGKYWEYNSEDEKYYGFEFDSLKDEFGEPIFSAKDIPQYNMFFAHIIENLTEDDIAKVIDEDTQKVVKEEITLKDNDNKDMTINCSLYTVKAGDIHLTLYINKGNIYRVKNNDDNTYYDIIYPTQKDYPTIPEEKQKDMYIVRLTSLYIDDTILYDAELDEKLNRLNSSFDTVIKVKQGETLEEVLIDDPKYANYRRLLQGYSYAIINLDAIPIVEVDLDTEVDAHLNYHVEVYGKYEDVSESLKDLATGGFDIKTSLEAFGEIITKEYFVDAGENIFSLAERPADPDMNVAIWNTIETLENLSYTFEKFESEIYIDDVDGEAKYRIYSFYKGMKDTVPYITLHLALEENLVERVIYYERDSSGKITTYTSEIVYSYRPYVEALESIKTGTYTVTVTNNSVDPIESDTYTEKNGVNLIGAETMPEGMNEDLWNMLQVLDDFVDDSQYEMNYVAATSTYTFTIKVDETTTIVYTIVIDIENNTIKSITKSENDVTGIIELSFDYSLDQVLNSLNDLKNTGYTLDFGLAEATERKTLTNDNRNLMGGDNNILDDDANGLSEDEEKMIAALQNLVNEDGYEITSETNEDITTYTFSKFDGDTSLTHTYTVVTNNGNALSITYSDGTNNYSYTVDFEKGRMIEALSLIFEHDFYATNDYGEKYFVTELKKKLEGITDISECNSIECSFKGIETIDVTSFSFEKEEDVYKFAINDGNDLVWNYSVTLKEIDLMGRRYVVSMLNVEVSDEEKVYFTSNFELDYNATILHIALKALENGQKTYTNIDDSNDKFIVPTVEDGQTYEDVIDTINDYTHRQMLLGLHQVRSEEHFNDYVIDFDSIANAYTIELLNEEGTHKWVIDIDNQTQIIYSLDGNQMIYEIADNQNS